MGELAQGGDRLAGQRRRTTSQVPDRLNAILIPTLQDQNACGEDGAAATLPQRCEAQGPAGVTSDLEAIEVSLDLIAKLHDLVLATMRRTDSPVVEDPEERGLFGVAREDQVYHWWVHGPVTRFPGG